MLEWTFQPPPCPELIRGGINGEPVFDVVQSHLTSSSPSYLVFYCALQQVFGDVFVSGDVSIPQYLSFLYSFQDWLLEAYHVIDGLRPIFI